MQLAPTSAPTAPASAADPARAADVPAFPRPDDVVKGDGPGTITGNWGTAFVGDHPVATEFGRAGHQQRIDVVVTAVNGLYYESLAHAVRAARIHSEGSFLGAVSINHANFVGAELRRLGTATHHGMAQYEFESIAQTAAGRRLLEQTLKVHSETAIIDGAWAAVPSHGAGNVRIVATKDYLAELAPKS